MRERDKLDFMATFAAIAIWAWSKWGYPDDASVTAALAGGLITIPLIRWIGELWAYVKNVRALLKS